MKKRNRIALLIVALIAFFVSAPAIVLYAMGYRLARLSQSQAVGVVYVATLPSDAATTIDGVSAGGTPRALTNLLPGQHAVTIQKDKYESWQKTVPVEPNVVTQLRDIRLFPQERTTLPLLARAVQFALAPDGRTLAVVTSDRHIHILRQDQTTPESFAAPLPFLPTTLSWSSDSSAVLLKNPKKSGYDVLDLTDAAPRVIPIDILQPATAAQWDGQIAGRVLFLNAAGQLRAYNIHTDASVIIGTDVEHFATGGRYIALATKTEVRLLDLQGEVLSIVTLPNQVVPAVIKISTDGSLAFSATTGDVYTWVAGQPLARIAQNIVKVEWSPDGALVLLQGKQSVAIYNSSLKDVAWLPVGHVSTLTSGAEPVAEAVWFAGSRYVAYRAAGQIRLSEIDTRGAPVVYVVDSPTTNNAHLAVGVDGALLYYLKQDASKVISLVAAKLAL